MLYFTLVNSKLEYASPVWNNIIATDANKLVRVQRKFVVLCCTRFFPHTPYNYACALELLKLYIYKFEGFALMRLFIHVFSRYKFCTSLIENISLKVPSCSIRSFTKFAIKVKVKVKFTLEQVTKTQRGIRGIALLFL